MSLDINFAAALGLQKVGTAAPTRHHQQPIQIINTRGVPSRIRKPTKVFDYEDIAPVKPAKRRRVAPSKATKLEVSDDKATETSDSTVATLDRVGSQRNGLRLRNRENRKQDLPSGSKIDPTHESEMDNNNSKSTTITKKPIVDFLLKLLDMVDRTNETIAAKKMKLVRLKSINDEAAILKSNGETIPDDFQLRYASTMLEVQELNSNLFNHLREIETFSRDLTKEPSITAMLTQNNQREQGKSQDQETVDSIISLITELATITSSVASNLSNQNLSESEQHFNG